MDIELTDGLSFKIFEQNEIHCPIIFTTAFDEYWQDALEQNSIDYLLKPIKQEKLENAINKYKKLRSHFSGNYASLLKSLPNSELTNGYRKRFLIKKGTDLVSIKAEDIAFAFAAHKLVFLVNNKGQRFILDKSLNDLEKELDPVNFFRANRKYLVNLQHIEKIKTIGKSKLLLELNPSAAEEVIISQENAGAFKQWIDA
jgi:two-component system LytT family response regulator